jgi:hypothetical protein
MDTPQAREPLPGTVKRYGRHLVVCTGQADWPEYIETGGGFLQAFAQTLVEQASAIAAPIKLTACDESSMGSAFDILVFPDQVRYLGVQEHQLSTLVAGHLAGNQVAASIDHQPLTQQYVFVCTHGRRDIRCGECGLPLQAALAAAIRDHGLDNEVAVRGSSHVGGHKFAGNVLIYPGGDWYGYVTPADVPRLVEQHLISGRLVTDLWRGRMGLSQQEQLELIASL